MHVIMIECGAHICLEMEREIVYYIYICILDSTKPFVFPCKVAAAGDENYLVCAADVAWIVSTRNWFLLCVLQRVVVDVCVLCVC